MMVYNGDDDDGDDDVDVDECSYNGDVDVSDS